MILFNYLLLYGPSYVLAPNITKRFRARYCLLKSKVEFKFLFIDPFFGKSIMCGTLTDFCHIIEWISPIKLSMSLEQSCNFNSYFFQSIFAIMAPKRLGVQCA